MVAGARGKGQVTVGWEASLRYCQPSSSLASTSPGHSLKRTLNLRHKAIFIRFFVCHKFVCCYKPRKFVLRLPTWARSKTPGCNNGGGGGNFSRVKRLVATCVGTRKRLFSGFLRTVGFQKCRNFFPRHILLINAYMHICPCSWALGICKNIEIRTYFALVTAESMGVFCHFCVLYKSTQTCHFFHCT